MLDEQAKPLYHIDNKKNIEIEGRKKMTDLNMYFSKKCFVDELNDLLKKTGVYDGTIAYHRCSVDGEYIHIVDWNIWINVEDYDKAAIMEDISKEMMGLHAYGRVKDPERKRYLMEKKDWSI